MPQAELEWLFEAPAREPVVLGPTVDPSLFYPDDLVIVKRAAGREHDDVFLGKVVRASYVSRDAPVYVVQSQMGVYKDTPIRSYAQFGRGLYVADASELVLCGRGSFVDYLQGIVSFDSWFEELGYLVKAGFAEPVTSFNADDPWTSLESLRLGLNANRVHAYDTSFNGYVIYLPVRAQNLRQEAVNELKGITPAKGFLQPKRKDRERMFEEFGFEAAPVGAAE